MKRVGIIAGVSFLAGCIFFALTFGYIQRGNQVDEPFLSPGIAHAAETEEITGLNFAPLVKKVKPAVVKVLSESIVEGRRFGDDFFDRFFREPQRRQRVSGEGSGFFISKDGYIITNNHVVNNSVKVRIIDINKNEYPAKIIGQDPETDLALLKVKGKNFPFIELGDSDSAEVGEWVLAIGNPFGQDLSVTSGIISAKGRDLSELEQRGITYQDFIQTDAAINQGNSGGPLIDMKGKVIGINSIIFAPAGGNVGVGFAISSNLANQVIEDLRDKGRVVRGFIGVSIIEISDSEAKDNDLPHGGVLVFTVEDHSPASRAGLKRWDLVLAINGKKIKSSRDLQNRISAFEPGETVTFRIFRDKEMDLKLKVAEKEGSMRLQRDSGNRATVDLGMRLENNSRAMEREYDLGTAKGVVITQVSRGGVAYEQGLRAGDVIIEVNRREVGSVREFSRIISGKKPGSRIMMTVNRYGRDLLVRFEIPE